MYKIIHPIFTIILCFLFYISINDVKIYIQTFSILQIVLLQFSLQNTFYDEYKSGFLEQIVLLPKPHKYFISILLRNYLQYGTPISIILFISLLILNNDTYTYHNTVYKISITILPILISNASFTSIFMLCNSILCSQEIKKSVNYIAIIPMCIPIFLIQNTLNFYDLTNIIFFYILCITITVINTIATYFSIKYSIR